MNMACFRITKKEVGNIDGNRFPVAVKLLESLTTDRAEYKEEMKEHISCQMEHGHINDALCTIAQAKERGMNLEIAPEQYTTAFDACINEGMIENAETVIAEASKVGIELRITRELYNVALDKCITDGNIERADKVIASATKMNVDLTMTKERYDAALNICIDDGEITNANKVVASAAKAGIELEITLEQYRKALSACVKQRYPAYTVDVVASASQKGIKDVDLYQTALNACVDMGWAHDIDKTVALANDMGIKLSITLEQYRKALNKCIERDSWNHHGGISTLLASASRNGIKDVELYLTAINATKNSPIGYREVIVEVINAKMDDDRLFAAVIEHFAMERETDKLSEIIKHLTTLSGERDQWQNGDAGAKRAKPTLLRSLLGRALETLGRK